MTIARASLAEVKYQLLLSRDLKYLSDSDYNAVFAQTNEVGKIINGIILALNKNICNDN